jgi:type II secretory pathway pseudopilin PulG
MRRAFTLVELVVVIGIIILMSTMAVPALHNLLLQQQMSSVVQTFGGAVASARATAQSNFTTAAIRVERAFATDDAGEMIKDADGNPRWLNYQRIRTVVLGVRQPQNPIPGEEFAFRQTADKAMTSLPSLVWLAPNYGVALAASGDTSWQPPTAGAAPIDTLDTFYIAFNRRGELMNLPSSRLVYLDETQNRLRIGHPTTSATGAIVYNHDRFQAAGRDPAELRKGLPLYIDRYSGEVLRGEQGK